MSQSAIESLFGDDSFFEPTFLLWPRRSTAQTSFREHFLRRRAQLMESFQSDIRDDLFRELTDGLHRDLFQTLEGLCSAPASRISANQAQDKTLAWTLDTQGFSPEEISVTVSGRRLEVMAAKGNTQTAASGDSAESKPTGFVQSVALPDHVDPTMLTCTQGEDGLLRIESETKQDPPEERTVPVRFRTSLDFPLTRDDTSKTAEVSSEKST
ncbi:heat shock protein beta-9 [Salminus brasiliensis]|uniref:heat shock protein beta-9 n=1 Tax=Salminus brasiliensis TaxID=930266 RepID=UPI003B8377DE